VTRMSGAAQGCAERARRDMPVGVRLWCSTPARLRKNKKIFFKRRGVKKYFERIAAATAGVPVKC
jgi:hypothetical protein